MLKKHQLFGVKKNTLLFILFLSVVVLCARLIPHAPNFSPLASVILFGSVYITNKKYLILPFIALFISDIFLGFYGWQIMLSVYGSLALIILIGQVVSKYKNVINIISASLLGGIIFFAVTNFSVWYFGNWYAADLSGLLASYTMAIPFFKNTIASNLVYSGILFGVYELAQYFAKQKTLAYKK
jgi:hypothetical protein